MENEPAADELDITISGEPYRMNRNNSSLFTFCGELAVYNHLFLVQEEKEEAAVGTYVWKSCPAFQQLVSFVVEHAYPMHLNLTEVAQCDMNAFDAYLHREAADLDGDFPDEWNQS